jgi:hypothetical protein
MTRAANLAAQASNINDSGVAGVPAGGTGLADPGASGNLLTSNGTVWTSAAPPASTVVVVSSSEMFTTSGEYTVPTLAEDEYLYAMMIGGGGGGAAIRITTLGTRRNAQQGGGGTIGIAPLKKSAIGSTITYTIGAGGAGATSNETAVVTTSAQKGGSTILLSGSTVLAEINGGDQGASSNNESSTSVTRIGETQLLSSDTIFSQVVYSNIQATQLIIFKSNGRSISSDGTTFNIPQFFGGGSAGNSGGTARNQNITGASATTYTGAGGTGSTSANGGAGSTPGGGGGGCLRYNVNAVAGSGAAGGVKFFVIKGIHDPLSVFNTVFTL